MESLLSCCENWTVTWTLIMNYCSAYHTLNTIMHCIFSVIHKLYIDDLFLNNPNMNRLIIFFSLILFVSSALAADYDNIDPFSYKRMARHKTFRRRQTGATTCTSSKTTATSSASASAKSPIKAAWVADWVPFDNLTWGSYTMLTYSFGVTMPDPPYINITNPDNLRLFVKTAKEKNVKAFVSLGGSQGSIYFSPLSTAQKRATFVNALVQLVANYSLDGLDFDWEFPGGNGLPCNKVDASDTDNFLALLIDLRRALDGDKKTKSVGLSAAVGMLPFLDETGSPRTDVSDFAEVLDHVAIMAYDVFGSWSNNQTGPNAPLTGDECMKSALPSSAFILTADSSVDAWTKAGMPLDKCQIVLGIPAYGRSYNSLEGVDDKSQGIIATYPQFHSIPQGYPDIKDGEGPPDACGAPQSHSGVFTFEGLVDVGYLKADGSAADNVTYVFDDCTKTSFLQDEKNGILISYDDQRSFGEKGKYIIDKKLAGFAMWHAASDYHGLLVGAVSEAL
ncbi:glycoside hydrolase superfamily [Mucidula mucida]|nr:glycoside hydrolase superfamily [Mucidula mucida]